MLTKYERPERKRYCPACGMERGPAWYRGKRSQKSDYCTPHILERGAASKVKQAEKMMREAVKVRVAIEGAEARQLDIDDIARRAFDK